MGDAINCIIKKVSIVLEKKLKAIRDPISEISGKLDSMIKKVKEAEHRISDLEDNQANSSTRLASVELSLQKTLERVEDLENRSQRQNIRIIGLKEGTEGSDPTAFFETWIPATLNMNAKDGWIKLESAHPTGPLRNEGEHPRVRPVIIRLHSYKDKRLILEASECERFTSLFFLFLIFFSQCYISHSCLGLKAFCPPAQFCFHAGSFLFSVFQAVVVFLFIYLLLCFLFSLTVCAF